MACSPERAGFEVTGRDGRKQSEYMEDGLRTQLIQHVSQLNVLLRAVPKEQPEDPPRRIGFQMMQQWAGGESGDGSV